MNFNKPYTDSEVANFLMGFNYKETKEEVTKLYIEGKITKDEFIKRMDKAR